MVFILFDVITQTRFIFYYTRYTQIPDASKCMSNCSCVKNSSKKRKLRTLCGASKGRSERRSRRCFDMLKHDETISKNLTSNGHQLPNTIPKMNLSKYAKKQVITPILRLEVTGKAKLERIGGSSINFDTNQYTYNNTYTFFSIYFNSKIVIFAPT